MGKDQMREFRALQSLKRVIRLKAERMRLSKNRDSSIAGTHMNGARKEIELARVGRENSFRSHDSESRYEPFPLISAFCEVRFMCREEGEDDSLGASMEVEKE